MRLLPTLLLALPALAFAQGALVPTGTPAPTMKTLDQLEARIPLGVVGTNTTELTISQPGSYVLMGDVSVPGGAAIRIAAQNVTLNLNGFTLSSTSSPASGTAIYLPSGSNFTIRNGHIRGEVTRVEGTTFTTSGFLNGIDATYVSGVCIENVSVDGVAAYGISLANGDGVIRSCRARFCGTTGLRANQVLDSIALKCGDTAIHAGTAPDTGTPAIPVANGIAVNCTGECLAGGRGIFATTATNCIGTSASGIGLEATTATDCTGTSESGLYGLWAAASAENCRGTISSTSTDRSAGLRALTALNCSGKIGTTTGISCSGLMATNATNCTGRIDNANAGSSAGLAATTATGCSGSIGTTATSGGQTGLTAGTATNCRGEIASNAASIEHQFGLSASVAENCIGTATRGNGLYATYSATNCRGKCGFMVGIGVEVANGTASSCVGESGNGLGGFGTAIKAAIAVSCTSTGGTIDAPQKFLGTP